MILIVEDNELVAEWLSESVRLLGYEPAKAADGEIAMSLLIAAERAPALVLVDFGLPHMTGLELAIFIRAMPGPLSRVPIVALTGGRYPIQSAEQLEKAHLSAIVQKPLLPRQLEALITTFAQYPAEGASEESAP
jgi:CheY-like chemotaxis protein